jgi:hypothetical protein
MSDPRHSERLLTDVLGEGVSTDFRTGLLNETLRLARRRRRVCQVRRVAVALAMVAALGIVVGHQSFVHWRSPRQHVKPYTLVRTRPLPPAAWVSTRPLSAARLVASATTQNIILTAVAGRRVPIISDDELLALAPKPAALVRFGPHSAELVFVNRDEGQAKLQY